jgi:pyridoxamine 5'-phosphate oxidase
MRSLADLRQEYSLAGLSEDEAGMDPFALFHRWFADALAAELLDPNAMILATCTPQGKPSARAVLLKHLDERGFTFFTNYDSRKGEEIAANAQVALVFLWHPLERQIRIEGVAEKVSAQESDDYYRVRPLGSRLGAWASPQSSVIPDRSFLEKQQQDLMAKYPDGEVPRTGADIAWCPRLWSSGKGVGVACTIGFVFGDRAGIGSAIGSHRE